MLSAAPDGGALATSISLRERRRGVRHLSDPAPTGVHVHAARYAWVERPNRPHDVDPLEVLGAVLLEDRRVLHGVLVGPGRPVHVAGARVPGRRRGRLGGGGLSLPG